MLRCMQDCCFLPQKPYMPLGTLRQQLLFPHSDDDPTQVGTVGSTDAELRALAARACLSSALQVPCNRESSQHALDAVVKAATQKAASKAGLSM